MINALDVGIAGCRPNQIRALVQFKNEFESGGCNNSDYFQGVMCDNTTGVVTKLELPSGCFTGILKPNSSLFELHHLQYLDLSNNNFNPSSLSSRFSNLNKLEVLFLSSNGFTGQVPFSFSNLSQLSYLDISQNELTGSFQLIRNLSKLSFLDLSFNHFSGTLNPSSSLFELHHLFYLHLSHNNLGSSPLPSEFGNFNRLEMLSLSSNGFHGQVPSSFSNLSRLTVLNLGNNSLTGSVHFVQNYTKLCDLKLSNNNFSGTIPSSLLTMPFLAQVDLSGNALTGLIEGPNSSSSSQLEILYLQDNQFQGQILEPISKLINLRTLDLAYQNISYPIDLNLFSSINYLAFLDLSGNSISPTSSYVPLTLEVLVLMGCGISQFPNFLKGLNSLTRLHLSHNRIKGKVPEWFWKLPRLSIVTLSNNSLTGFEGSVEVLENSSVKILDLALNHFEGPLPNPPHSLSALSTWNNSFTGNIPLALCNRSFLAVLDLSYNNFTGSIPGCLSNLHSLIILNLRKNNLEGSLPDMCYDDDALLRTLDVGYNRLNGKLPRSLMNCSSLKFLSVHNNRMKDTFPFWLKALPYLQALILRSNKFYGTISPSDQGSLAFPELRIFEVSYNNFTGSLPPDYFVNWKASSSLQMNEDGRIYMGYYARISLYYYDDNIDLEYKGLSMEQANILTSYATIDFSGNGLEGQIPESIGLLRKLIALNLSNNAFTGHIPLSLSNVSELESLDLSNNQLSGTIPEGLGSLSFLEYISVAHNQLKGKIPQGTQNTGQPKSSFEGNAGLCGLPLQQICFRTNAPPMQQPEEEEKEEEEDVLNWEATAIRYGTGLLFGLAIGHVIASFKPEWLVKIIGLSKRRNR
ncbi:hypothetical protein Bca52824_003936 [Brassica carinata]|uniref:Receptor-like protein 12 n=1 Tax=Brassica carinata TaxID=52824 RepID=A0A8X7WMZ4_BRACI|nr:hypothetical protein Bca52824_003936 [Brassica carinata]